MLSRALERNVIACMLSNLDCLESSSLPPAAYETDSLRIAYSMIKELQGSGNEVNINTLRAFFDQRDDFAELVQLHGGWQFIENLGAKPDMLNFKMHLEELTRRFAVRETRANAVEALEQVKTAQLASPSDIYDILDKHMSGNDATLANEAMNASDYDDEWLALQSQRYLSGDFTNSGIPVLNEHLRRIMGDQLVHGSMLILSGETNVGKSQWVHLLVRHFTVQQGIPTLVFDNELSRREFQNRALSNISGVRMKKIFNGSAFDPKNIDFSEMKKSIKVMQTAPLLWRQLLDMSAERMEPIIRRFLRQYPKDQYPHKLIIVDGIKMQSGNDSFIEVGFFAQKLKALAQKFESEGVVMAPTCQLNRTGTARNIAKEKDVHPDHNNIGLSKMIADNADDVYILLKHPVVEGNGQKAYSKDHRRLITTKARNHATFDGQNFVVMIFDGARCFLEPVESNGVDIDRDMPVVDANQQPV
jgi:replicative DNA helicase